MKLIYDSLNKKGILIIKTPNSETIFSGRYHYWDFTHEIIFNKTSLMQILSLTGFNNFVFKEEYPIIHGFKSFIRFFWRFFRLILNFYLLVETGQKAQILTQNIIVKALKR